MPESVKKTAHSSNIKGSAKELICRKREEEEEGEREEV